MHTFQGPTTKFLHKGPQNLAIPLKSMDLGHDYQVDYLVEYRQYSNRQPKLDYIEEHLSGYYTSSTMDWATSYKLLILITN